MTDKHPAPSMLLPEDGKTHLIVVLASAGDKMYRVRVPEGGTGKILDVIMNDDYDIVVDTEPVCDAEPFWKSRKQEEK